MYDLGTKLSHNRHKINHENQIRLTIMTSFRRLRKDARTKLLRLSFPRRGKLPFSYTKLPYRVPPSQCRRTAISSFSSVCTELAICAVLHGSQYARLKYPFWTATLTPSLKSSQQLASYPTHYRWSRHSSSCRCSFRILSTFRIWKFDGVIKRLKQLLFKHGRHGVSSQSICCVRTDVTDVICLEHLQHGHFSGLAESWRYLW